MRARLAVAVATLLLVGGCASIPSETAPQQADLQGGKVAPGIAQPPRGEDALTTVRGFIDENGDPTNQHSQARGYLAESAQRTWALGSAPSRVVIIDDTFSTVFGDEPKADPNLDDVQVNTALIGTVDTNGAFTPASPQEAGSYDLSFQVRRGKDGQWRILNPPDELVVALGDFDSHYHAVPIYFFDQGWSVLVPDERYVVNDPVGQPARIVQLLLDGPSDSLRDAVQDAIPPGASLKTNVTVQSDGEIYVNFKGMTDLPGNTKQLMVAQILESLQNAQSGAVVVDAENLPLISGHPAWTLGDLPSYGPYPGPNSNGLVVAQGRIVSLDSGHPITGPAGDGDYDVLTAAESMDGQELATVTTSSTGDEELRIGGLRNGEPPVKDLLGSSFTRPTWEPGDSAGDPSRAVWTVVDGSVYRVVNTAQGNWVPASVEASALRPYGHITDLRLSPDGVRVAVAAGGHLLVGTVVMDQGQASIKQVQLISNPALASVTHVDWQRQDLMVVATTKSTAPVESVSIDGEHVEAYSQANLTSQVTGLAASPNGNPLLVADDAGIWSTTDVSEVWRLIQHHQPAGAIPFYPG